MRRLLAFTAMAVLLASGCASFGTEGDKTASLMTSTPHPKQLDRASRAEARRASAAQRRAARQQGTYVTSDQPATRSERAVGVLRRSPVTRWMFPARSLGPANPGAGPRGSMGSSMSPSAQPIPSARPVTPVPGPTPMPGEGRIIVGRAQDPGTGIKSSVTGTPVEPIAGATTMGVTTAPASIGASAASGTAAAASAPPATTPAPKTTTKPATKPSKEPIVIERNPDGTPVIKNVDDEETSSTKKPN